MPSKAPFGAEIRRPRQLPKDFADFADFADLPTRPLATWQYGGRVM